MRSGISPASFGQYSWTVCQPLSAKPKTERKAPAEAKIRAEPTNHPGMAYICVATLEPEVFHEMRMELWSLCTVKERPAFGPVSQTQTIETGFSSPSDRLWTDHP